LPQGIAFCPHCRSTAWKYGFINRHDNACRRPPLFGRPGHYVSGTDDGDFRHWFLLPFPAFSTPQAGQSIEGCSHLLDCGALSVVLGIGALGPLVILCSHSSGTGFIPGAALVD